MTLNQVAWGVRTVMVVTSAVVTFLLVQSDVPLEPAVKVALGAVQVALAALNPTTVASKITAPED